MNITVKNILKKASLSEMSFKSRVRLASISLTFVLFILFATFSPNQLGPIGITVVSVLVYLLVASLITLIRLVHFTEPVTYDQRKKLILSSGAMSLPIIALVVLNTLRQLTITDVLLVLGIFFVVKFYLSRK